MNTRTAALDCEPVALLHLAAAMTEATLSSSSSLPTRLSVLHDLTSQHPNRVSFAFLHPRQHFAATVPTASLDGGIIKRHREPWLQARVF